MADADDTLERSNAVLRVLMTGENLVGLARLENEAAEETTMRSTENRNVAFMVGLCAT